MLIRDSHTKCRILSTTSMLTLLLLLLLLLWLIPLPVFSHHSYFLGFFILNHYLSWWNKDKPLPWPCIPLFPSLTPFFTIKSSFFNFCASFSSPPLTSLPVIYSSIQNIQSYLLGIQCYFLFVFVPLFKHFLISETAMICHTSFF